MPVIRSFLLVVVAAVAECLLWGALPRCRAEEPICISGVYPHLRMFNHEGECGTGAVVVWQGHLWAITYAPHAPGKSTDKLYQITPELEQRIFPGSVGGTHANRMIHRETNQLLIGPYVIDAQGTVRVIPRSKLYGRLTATARHLRQPERLVYYATMEEGLYEVDVRTLQVRCLIRDGHPDAPPGKVTSNLPGRHGKGLYAGQGRLVFSNNGEHGRAAQVNPNIPSGALAQWFGQGDWRLVRRCQFTEVTGPGGIYGNPQPETDPVWAWGWDAKSLLLAVLHRGQWSFYRLPKASHCYDGAHGWNTEWPRIRDIGEPELLATMHGTFWKFPREFSPTCARGIRPRSTYLKVVGDFCRWRGFVVLGCDDSARSEFLNTRRLKAPGGAPKQSNSNLWFLAPEQLDRLGPVIGHGSVWRQEDVRRGQASEPYLFAGYDYRQLWLTHGSDRAVGFRLEVDRHGTGQWTLLRTVEVPARGAVFLLFRPQEQGEWIRLVAQADATAVTAHFEYRNHDPRSKAPHPMFQGLARLGHPARQLGLMRSLSHDRLGMVVATPQGQEAKYYELSTPAMQWQQKPLPTAAIEKFVRQVAQPEGVYRVDRASVVIEEGGKRFRLPKNPAYERLRPSGDLARMRVCREVVTERDLLHIHGTFYELPARNALGLARLRPIATHELQIHDFCSHNGLLFLTGLDAHSRGPHVFRSRDGNAAVWAGVVDDLWKLGKPRGTGGPWFQTPVRAGEPSDPYLMTGYDHKRVRLESTQPATIRLEVDIDGTGLWVPYRSFPLEPGEPLLHEFPRGFSAYWIRAVSDQDTTATVLLTYD